MVGEGSALLLVPKSEGTRFPPLPGVRIEAKEGGGGGAIPPPGIEIEAEVGPGTKIEGNKGRGRVLLP